MTRLRLRAEVLRNAFGVARTGARGLLAGVARRVARTVAFQEVRAALLRLSDRCDAIHVHGTFWSPLLLAAMAAAREKRIPLIIKVANEPKRVLAELSREPAALAALHQADAVIAVSQDALAALRQELPEGRAVWMPNAVEIPPTPGGDPSGPLLFVGTLKPQKGIEVLLDAWSRTDAAQLERTLLLVGDGPERASLERASSSSRGVRFCGHQADVATYLRTASVFVLPSHFEGMPNALLEAMAWGLPCVATRIGGVVDLVTDGVDGRLVPPGDAGALATALDEVLRAPDLAARLGKSARERVRAQLAPDVLAPQWETLYQRLRAGAQA